MNTPILQRCEALLNLIYLAEAQAAHPERVTEYMKQARLHLEEIIRLEQLGKGPVPSPKSPERSL